MFHIDENTVDHVLHEITRTITNLQCVIKKEDAQKIVLQLEKIREELLKSIEGEEG